MRHLMQSFSTSVSRRARESEFSALTDEETARINAVPPPVRVFVDALPNTVGALSAVAVLDRLAPHMRLCGQRWRPGRRRLRLTVCVSAQSAGRLSLRHRLGDQPRIAKPRLSCCYRLDV